jgi:hypothetical protein
MPIIAPLPTDRFPEAANGRGLKASRAVGAADPKGPARMPARARIEAALVEAKPQQSARN